MTSEIPEILAVWSGPRCLSTALMYSFAQRSDTRVLDEPLFGYFLSYTGVERPSRREVLRAMSCDADGILRSFRQPLGRPFLMLKNMANHTEGLPLHKMDTFRNVVLTRHPAKVLASYTAQVQKPSMLDLGYAHKLAILQHLQEQGLPLWVLESDILARKPEQELRRLCAYFKIPFDPEMLQWQPGPRPEDGIWAKYWYHSVHRSSGFVAPADKAYSVPAALQPLYQECMQYYLKIKSYEQVQPS